MNSLLKVVARQFSEGRDAPATSQSLCVTQVEYSAMKKPCAAIFGDICGVTGKVQQLNRATSCCGFRSYSIKHSVYFAATVC